MTLIAPILTQIPADDTGRLLTPLGRTKLAAITWIMPVTIKPGQMVILACFVETPDGTDIIPTGYQIAERAGSRVKKGQFGTEIQLCGWSERRQLGSGIWYAPTPNQRRSITKWEFADDFLPISLRDYLPMDKSYESSNMG